MPKKNKNQALKYLAAIAVTAIVTFLLNNYTTVYQPFSCTYNQYSCAAGGGLSGGGGNAGAGGGYCPTTPDLNCNSCRTGYILMNGICTPYPNTPTTPDCRDVCFPKSMSTLDASTNSDCYRVAANTCYLASTTHTLTANHYFDTATNCCCYNCV